jgi:hypothetical protein
MLANDAGIVRLVVTKMGDGRQCNGIGSAKIDIASSHVIILTFIRMTVKLSNRSESSGAHWVFPI